MGRGRSGSTAKSKPKAKKKGLSCPDGVCYLGGCDDSESACSDSDCSDCYDGCGPSRPRQTSAKSKPKPKSKPKTKPKKKKKASKRRNRDSSTSCSCSDCLDGYSSDDSYNCRPTARGRKCSTC